VPNVSMPILAMAENFPQVLRGHTVGVQGVGRKLFALLLLCEHRENLHNHHTGTTSVCVGSRQIHLRTQPISHPGGGNAKDLG